MNLQLMRDCLCAQFLHGMEPVFVGRSFRFAALLPKSIGKCRYIVMCERADTVSDRMLATDLAFHAVGFLV